jgi:vitamin B12 transporter
MHNKQFKKSELLHFRKYSRKKFAVFVSIGKQIKIATLSLICTLIISPAKSQSKTDSDTVSKKLDLEEVEVIGQKSAILIDELPRMVELIPAKEIQNSPSQSYQDFIEYRSNIDIRQRGPAGIQSDISIRGGSFDQTLILLNGINLTDPQTGHHSLNLPIDPETISKIEILNGPAARALGANAYNGAINVIAVPGNKNAIDASVQFGDFGYFRSHLGLNYMLPGSKHLLTVGYSRSNGYDYNTDFKAVQLFYSGEFEINPYIRAFSYLGLSSKNFGANGYYTPRFPDQFESNKNLFVAAGVKSGRTFRTKAQVYYRRFADCFQLFREGPGFYERTGDGYLVKDNSDTATYGPNYHLTQIFGSDITSTYRHRYGKSTLGASVRSENLLSNSLGDRLIDSLPVKGTDSAFYFRQGSRNVFEVYFEHVYQLPRFFISAGIMANWNSFRPTDLQLFPGIDIRYSIAKPLSLTSSYNYTLGLPTFTDLNYQGPANSGNDKLQPYSQHSYEVGYILLLGNFKLKNTGFFTKGENNIEWVLNNETYRFSPVNVPYSENLGVEFSLQYINSDNRIPKYLLSNLYLGYTYIDTYRQIPEGVSKYANIRQKLVFTLQQQPIDNLSLNWNIMYKERIGEYQQFNSRDKLYESNSFPQIWLMNVKANYHYQFADFFLEVSNLFDVRYYEAGSILQPGRWIIGGIKINIEWHHGT